MNIQLMLKTCKPLLQSLWRTEFFYSRHFYRFLQEASYLKEEEKDRCLNEQTDLWINLINKLNGKNMLVKTTPQANVTACYINNVWRDRIYTQTHARIRIIRFVFSRPYF